MSDTDTNYSYFMGIDPGINGAISVISEDGKALAYKMPVTERIVSGKTKKGNPRVRKSINEDELYRMLKVIVDVSPNMMCMIENVHSMPRDGGVQGFSFGDAFGFIKGVCKGLGVKYNLISPQRWQNAILGKKNKLIGPDGKIIDEGKKRYIDWAEAKFGRTILIPSNKRVPDSDIAASLAIATYCRQLYGKSDAF